MNTFFTSTLNQVLGSLVLAGAVLALITYANLNWQASQYVSDYVPTITVDGMGEVVAVPDLGTFSFSVIARAETAEAAQADAAERNNAIVAYLAEAGVAETDVKTVNYNVYPQYRYEDRTCQPGGFCPPGDRVLTGYEVQQGIEILVRDTADAGTLISGVGQRGADNISSLQFTIDDDTTYVNEARALAIADAKQRAEQLAEALGVRLVQIVSYNESGAGHSPYARSEMMGMGGDMAMDSVAPDMPVGEDTITRNITITYEVR